MSMPKLKTLGQQFVSGSATYVPPSSMEVNANGPASASSASAAESTNFSVNRKFHPCLLLLDAEAQTTIIKRFPIFVGETRLGSNVDVDGQDIPIFGEGVSPLHCFLTNDGSCVTLTPFCTSHANTTHANNANDDVIVDGICSIDGERLTETHLLTQGNVILLGKSICFRFHDFSVQAGASNRERFSDPSSTKGLSSKIADFETKTRLQGKKPEIAAKPDLSGSVKPDFSGSVKPDLSGNKPVPPTKPGIAVKPKLPQKPEVPSAQRSNSINNNPPQQPAVPSKSPSKPTVPAKKPSLPSSSFVAFVVDTSRSSSDDCETNLDSETANMDEMRITDGSTSSPTEDDAAAQLARMSTTSTSTTDSTSESMSSAEVDSNPIIANSMPACAADTQNPTTGPTTVKSPSPYEASSEAAMLLQELVDNPILPAQVIKSPSVERVESGGAETILNSENSESAFELLSISEAAETTTTTSFANPSSMVSAPLTLAVTTSPSSPSKPSSTPSSSTPSSSIPSSSIPSSSIPSSSTPSSSIPSYSTATSSSHKTSSLSQTISKLSLHHSHNKSSSSNAVRDHDQTAVSPASPLPPLPPHSPHISASPTPSPHNRLSSNSFLGEKLLFSNSNSRHSVGSSRSSLSPTPLWIDADGGGGVESAPDAHPSPISPNNLPPPPIPPHHRNPPIIAAHHRNPPITAAHPDAILTDEFMIDGRHITYYEDDESTNLSADHQNLLQKHREIVEARKKEQEAQKAESERLDEILRICEEYAKQQVVTGGEDEDGGETEGGAGGDGEENKDVNRDETESSIKKLSSSPQSPPPLTKPGRKAYGLGLLSNASVEASKEILKTGAVASSSSFGGSLDAATDRQHPSSSKSPPQSPILDGSNYCQSPAFQRAIKTNGSLHRMRKKQSNNSSLQSFSSEDSLDDLEPSEASSSSICFVGVKSDAKSSSSQASSSTAAATAEEQHGGLTTVFSKDDDDEEDADYDDPPPIPEDEDEVFVKRKTSHVETAAASESVNAASSSPVVSCSSPVVSCSSPVVSCSSPVVSCSSPIAVPSGITTFSDRVNSTFPERVITSSGSSAASSSSVITCIAEVHASAGDDNDDDLVARRSSISPRNDSPGLGVLQQTVHEGLTSISFTFAEDDDAPKHESSDEKNVERSVEDAADRAGATSSALSDASSNTEDSGALSTTTRTTSTTGGSDEVQEGAEGVAINAGLWQKEDSHDSGLRLSGSSDSSSSDKLLASPSVASTPASNVSPAHPPHPQYLAATASPASAKSPRSRERQSIIDRLATIKLQVTELEQQQTEVIREMELERALLEGEHKTERDAMAEEEEALESLRMKETQLLERAAEAKQTQAQHLLAEKRKIESIEEKLRSVASQVESIRDADEREKLDAHCKVIVDALESERKVFEDMEFQQLETESKYEEEREEIQRELLREQETLEDDRRERELRLREIDDQQRQMLLQCKTDTEALEAKREKLVAEFQLEKEKLREMEKVLQAGGFLMAGAVSSPKNGGGKDGSWKSGNAVEEQRRRRIKEEEASGPRFSQSSDTSDSSSVPDDIAARGNFPASPSPVPASPVAGGGSNNNSAYNTLRSNAAQQEKRKLLEMKKKMIEETLGALKAKSRVNTANNSPRSSPVHFHSPAHQQQQQNLRHLSASSLDPNFDRSAGATTATSDELKNLDELSVTGLESDKGETASGCSVDTDASLPSRNNSFKNRPPQQPALPADIADAADCLSPEMQQLLATQLQHRSEEDRRVREELELKLAEEKRLRQVMEVQLRDKKSAAQARPLTRYLPVRGGSGSSGSGGKDFNLRAHIETAGHQVDLCSDVIVDGSSCRGFLHKLGGSKFKVWNRRWFVLDRTKRSLTYYADRNEAKSRGVVYFQSIQETYPDHLQTAAKSPNPKLTFVVKTLDRPYYLCAPSAEAMRIWVDVIFTGAEGYEAYIS